jgi:hypothetical protein
MSDWEWTFAFTGTTVDTGELEGAGEVTVE